MKKWAPSLISENLLIGSTLVEGSTLTEAEAELALKGKTIQGHPVGEIRELLNYEAATRWLVKRFSESPFLSLDIILDYHLRLFSGLSNETGQLKSNQNYTYRVDGTRLNFEKPSRVKEALQNWIRQFNEVGDLKDVKALGARLYYDFEMIHPFSDGSGRMGRVLLAYWFWRNSQTELTFYLKDKVAHLKALQAANEGDLKPLTRFFETRLK